MTCRLHWDDLIGALCARGEWCFDLLERPVREKMELPLGDERPTVAALLQKLSEAEHVPDIRGRQLPRVLRPYDDDSVVAEGLVHSTNRSVPSMRISSEPVVPKETLAEAIDLIACFGGLTFDCMQEHHYAIFEVEDVGGISFSQENCYGIIFLSESPNVSSGSLSVTLVHEFAHQELFLLNFFDPLVSASGINDERHSPFQGKARPTIGRLHAAHALFRMTQFIDQASWPLAPDTARDLLGVTDTLEDGLLTELGQRLLNEVYRPMGERVASSA